MRSKDKGIKMRRKQKYGTAYCYPLALGHIVELMFLCAITLYITVLAAELEGPPDWLGGTHECKWVKSKESHR